MASSGNEEQVVGVDVLPKAKAKKPAAKDKTKELTARIDKLEETLAFRFARIEEALMGPGKSNVEEFRSHFANLISRVEELEEKVEAFDEKISESRSMVDVEDNESRKNLESRVASLEVELELCKRAVVGGQGSGQVTSRKKVRAPEPKSYDGARDAREIDNFVWNMERYLDNMKIEGEVDKIETATMYLVDTAMLWWRRRHSDIEKGLCKIETWEQFKRDLKKHFYPENVEFEAYKKLRRLEHTGSLREYVKEYSALMLEIPDMPERESLFGFLDGLQPWAAQELQRRGVRELATALAEAEKLVDFKSKGSRKSHTKGGGDHRRKRSGESSPKSTDEERSDGESRRRRDHKDRKDRKDRGRSTKAEEKKEELKCYLCDGPHMIRNCPKKKALNAIQKKKKSKEGSDCSSSSRSESEDQQFASLQLLGAVSKKNAKKELPRTSKGLMYAEVIVNGEPASAMIDTGATHNFVSIDEAKRLGLKVKQEQGWSKPVNGEAKPIHGVVRSTDIAMNGWSGKVEFTVAELDDYPLILGEDFLVKSKAIPIPHMAVMILLQEEGAVTVPMRRSRQVPNTKSLAAVQGEKQGECKDTEEASTSSPKKKTFADVVKGDTRA